MPTSTVTGGAAAKKRSATAKKAAKTRKANAEKRSAAAKKAARTRKANASKGKSTAAKRKPATKKKTGAKRKPTTKKKTGAKKTGTRRSMADYERQAKTMGIPLSKEGHKKTKEQLQRAIAYRKAHKKR